MPPCAQALGKTIAALVAAAATLAPVGPGAAPAVSTLPTRLEQHTLMLAAAAHSSSAADAPAQAARYIEIALASQGHIVSRRDYRHQGQAMHSIEVTVGTSAGGHRPSRVLVIGASYASSTRRNDGETAVVIELARLLKGLRPAEGTELKFVFFVNGVSDDTGNFIAFAGTRGAAEQVRKTLASFRAAFPTEGLAAPAYVEGVTLLGDGSHRQVGDPALMITDIAFLHYPYSHTRNATYDQRDYASMARNIAGLARLVAGIAAPASM